MLLDEPRMQIAGLEPRVSDDGAQAIALVATPSTTVRASASAMRSMDSLRRSPQVTILASSGS